MKANRCPPCPPPPPQPAPPTPGPPPPGLLIAGGQFRITADNRLAVFHAFGIDSLEVHTKPNGARCWRITGTLPPPVTEDVGFIATAVRGDGDDPLTVPTVTPSFDFANRRVMTDICLVGADGQFVDPSILGLGTGAGVDFSVVLGGTGTFIAP